MADARSGAARALAAVGGIAAAALLRLRILAGEPDDHVLGECVEALLRLEPASSIALVERLLARSDANAEVVALAVGASGAPAAFGVLSAWHEAVTGTPAARTALLAIGALHDERAIAWLLERVRDDAPRTAAAALEVLGARRDPALLARVAAAVAERDESVVRDALARVFPPQ